MRRHKRLVDHLQQLQTARVDVCHIIFVFVVGERPQAFVLHQFRKADNICQRGSERVGQVRKKGLIGGRRAAFAGERCVDRFAGRDVGHGCHISGTPCQSLSAILTSMKRSRLVCPAGRECSPAWTGMGQGLPTRGWPPANIFSARRSAKRTIPSLSKIIRASVFS